VVQRDPPELILLDIMMMPINGWEFLETLRTEYGLRDIPVIIFSAYPSIEETIMQLKDPNLGMLQKPVTFTELKKSIERYLH
jgi:CheY-like chemotaxis protein